jgi:hypothetical protein
MKVVNDLSSLEIAIYAVNTSTKNTEEVKKMIETYSNRQRRQDQKEIVRAKKLLDKVTARHYVAPKLKRQILNYLGLPF